MSLIIIKLNYDKMQLLEALTESQTTPTISSSGLRGCQKLKKTSHHNENCRLKKPLRKFKSPNCIFFICACIFLSSVVNSKCVLK